MIFELEDTSINNVAEAVDETTEHPPAHLPSTFETPDDVGVGLSIPSSKNIQQNRSHNAEDTSRKQLPPKISLDINSRPAVSAPTHTVHPRLDEAPYPGPLVSMPLGPHRFRYIYTAGEEGNWKEAGKKPREAATAEEILQEIQQRKLRIEARERRPSRFKPAMLPNLKILILTDVPSSTRRVTVIDALITFIRECAEQEEIARLEHLVWKTYHDGTGEEKEVGSIFRLQQLILEMTSAPDPVAPSRSFGDKRNSFTKSSTEGKPMPHRISRLHFIIQGAKLLLEYTYIQSGTYFL